MDTPAGFLRDLAALAVDLLTSLGFLDLLADALAEEDGTAIAGVARLWRPRVIARARVTGVTREAGALRLRDG